VLPDHEAGSWIERVQPKTPSDVILRLSTLTETEFYSIAPFHFGNRPIVLASFICRSGAWTPPWADDAFEEFLSEIEWIEFPDHGLTPRAFDREAAEAVLANMEHLLPKLRNSNFFSG